jgi:hypothetical protein
MLIKSLGVIEADPYAAFIERAFETEFEVRAASLSFYKAELVAGPSGRTM